VAKCRRTDFAGALMLRNTLRGCKGCFFSLLLAAQPAIATPQQDFISANIDPTIQPGDDFFQYANGGWFKRNPLPPTESAVGIDLLVREQLYVTLRDLHENAAKAGRPAGSDEQKIGDFWRTALDVDRARKLGAAPLKRELARIDAVKTRGQAIDAAFALQPLGVGALFGFAVSQDQKESDRTSVYAWQGGLGLPERDFYLNETKDVVRIRAAYLNHLARLLRLLGRSDVDARPAAAAVLRFETALARASRRLEDVRDPERNYQRIAPAEFMRVFTPSIDWTHQLAAWNVQPEFVAVGQPEFFAALDRIVVQAPVAVLKDYLRLRLVNEYAEYLSPAFDAAYFDFHKRVLAGQKAQRPRWKRVLDTEGGFSGTPNPVGMLVGKRYVAAHFAERAKQRYTAMSRAFIEAYGERIKRLSWMTDATKSRALEKLAAIDSKVGYPDRWLDTSDLVIGRASYAENMMAIARWRFAFALRRFGKPVDRSEWLMSPQTYNAYYNPSNNEIVLPAAIFLIPGVADDDVDDAVAYAYAGASTIGHEVTHGFDDHGRKFDARGNLADWWTADDAAEFEKRADLLVKQFDAFEPLPGFRINGKATLGENIADLGGMAIGLDAFKKTDQYKNGTRVAGQTPLQRYFLGWAYSWMSQQREEQLRSRLMSDFHAPAKWRVLGPVANIAEFHEAFGVTPTQRMWRAPEERASVW
jgi:putative endopeptidase